MAANPDDLQDFYAQDLGPSIAIVVGPSFPSSSGGAGDVNGPLAPGKWLLQASGPGAPSFVFVSATPFVKNDISWNTMTAGAPATPLIRGWLEINVRRRHNDRIVARTSGGTATLFLTQISRVPQKPLALGIGEEP